MPSIMQRVPKPDEIAHKMAANECEKKINALKAKLAAAQAEISTASGAGEKSEYQVARSAKKQLVDELFGKKKAVSDQRALILDQIKKIQGNIKKKGDAVKSSKDKLAFKSVKEIDDQISLLEQQLSSGSVKLFEEKRIVQEISNLNKSRKILEGFSSQQASFDAEKADIDTLRAKLDSLNPVRDQLNKQLDQAKADLASFEAARKEQVGNMSELFATRNAIKAELDAEFDKVKALRAEFKEAKDAYYAYQRAERERRNEEYAAKKREERNARLAADALAEREAAEIPAFTDEINMCNNLIKYFSGISGTSTGNDKSVTEKAEIAPVDGMVPLKKKDDREEGLIELTRDFMVMGGKKNKKSKQAVAAPKALKLDFELIDQLSKLKLEIPTSVAQLGDVIQKIEGKMNDFKKNQAAQTEINKRKAEEKIAAIAAKAEAEAAEGEEQE